MIATGLARSRTKKIGDGMRKIENKGRGEERRGEERRREHT
jgi:hypothetical protein